MSLEVSVFSLHCAWVAILSLVGVGLGLAVLHHISCSHPVVSRLAVPAPPVNPSDTVEQYNEATGTGTGFKFWQPTPRAIFDTVGWAVSTYYDRKHHLNQMIQQAMAQDYSWEKSAHAYENLYDKALRNRQA